MEKHIITKKECVNSTTYSLRINTDDREFREVNEIIANTVSDLQKSAQKMVNNNPHVRGLTYQIFKRESVAASSAYSVVTSEKLVKEGVIGA